MEEYAKNKNYNVNNASYNKGHEDGYKECFQEFVCNR